MQKLRRVLVLSVVGASALEAQAVRGVVMTSDSTRVPGVIVTLIDANGTPVARALADDSGAYAMRAPAAGAYHIEASRLAFQPTRDADIVLNDGHTLVHTVRLAGAPVRLRGMRVTESERCERGTDPTSSALEVWEEARKALRASQLTRLTRAYSADITTFLNLEEDGRPETRTSSRASYTGLPLQPFASRPAEELAERGYTIGGNRREIYRAPDEEVLLSESFVATHCLRILPDSGTADVILLGFSPIPSRTQSDISGVVTIDRATAELRRLTFTFVNIGRTTAGRLPTGEIQFRHLSEGSWIMEQWEIRIPTEYSQVMSTEGRRKEAAQMSSAAALIRPIALQHFGHQTTGGYVDRVAFGPETVWSRETRANP